jgi:D-3-phosphoglycerate dehydrogenase
MNVVGFDPLMTVQSAWNLQPGIEESDNLENLLKQADIISIHIPLTDETKDFINTQELSAMKNDSILINLSRAEIVNNNAIQTALNKKSIKTYVTDFPDKTLLKNDNVFLLPHLGASTKEAEIKCAKMVAMSLKSFLEDGSINNSVNFPDVQLARTTGYRLTIANQNRPNIVGQFTTCLGEENININDLSHKNYNNIGYTVLDVDKPLTNEILQSISQIEGVITAKNLSKSTQ